MTDNHKEIQRVKALLPKYHAMPHVQKAVMLKPGESSALTKMRNEVEANRQKINAPRTLCKVEGCTRTKYAQGYCQTHYGRVKTHGDPQVHIPIRELNIKKK